MVIMSANISRHCEPCLSGLNVTFNARQYCTDCEESYCENCSPVHKSQKATRNHNLKDIEEFLDTVSLSKYCEPCLENGVSVEAVARCEECIESYCENCGRIHKSQKATRSHEIKTFQVEQSTEEKRQEIELYKWLDKMEEYRSEIAMTEKFKKEMTDNKDFTYKRSRNIQHVIPLRKGFYTMNCLHCNVTCHDNCECNNDEENKAKCDVMNSDGYCTVCEDNCYWDKHKSTPYRIEFERVEEDCTYTEMKRNYEMAEAEVKSHEAIVIKLKKELDETENDIIKWLALGANAKNIDFIIEKEKWGRKPGFQNRINNLKSLKKKIAFGDDEIKHLQKNKKATLSK